MPPVPAMFSMHEHMQERASKDEKPGQPAQKMRAMFRDQVESSDCQEAVQRNVRSAEAARPLLLVDHVVGVWFHDGLAGLVNLPNDDGHCPSRGAKGRCRERFGKSRFCSPPNVERSQVSSL